MPPSMPDLSPPHICLAPHASAASSPHTNRRALPTHLCKASPIPMGRTPGYLSRPINRPATYAQMDAHGGNEFAIQQANCATDSLSFLLTAP
eukprot:11064102-Ditylum_brightwellii.AAC.1